MMRWKARQCRSVQSIMGATQNLWASEITFACARSGQGRSAMALARNGISANESEASPQGAIASLTPNMRRASFVIAVLAIGKAGIAEPRANGQHAPALVVLHPRQLAQALHDGVVVDDDVRLVTADARHL